MQRHRVAPQVGTAGPPQLQLLSFVFWLTAAEPGWLVQPSAHGGPAAAEPAAGERSAGDQTAAGTSIVPGPSPGAVAYRQAELHPVATGAEGIETDGPHGRQLPAPAVVAARKTSGRAGHARGPEPAALGRAMTAHLEQCGHPGAEPLRWAITAVDPVLGWQVEGVAIRQSGQADDRAALHLPSSDASACSAGPSLPES